MKVFGNSTSPPNKIIIYWYLKKYIIIILLTLSIILLFDFGRYLYLKIIYIVLSLFIPLTFTRNIKRVIFNITFDDENKKLIIDYFILWKRRRMIPYHELHIESTIKSNSKKKEELIIYIWRKEFVSGDIVFPSKYSFWDRKQIVEMSKKFYNLKTDNLTYKPDISYKQIEIGKNNSFKRVDFFS